MLAKKSQSYVYMDLRSWETSLGRSIAACGREYVRISLGGLEMREYERPIGAMPDDYQSLKKKKLEQVAKFCIGQIDKLNSGHESVCY
jgi:ATP-dependent Lon protease